MKAFLFIFVFFCVGILSLSIQAENLNYMSSGQEEWSIERMQKDITKLEGEIKLSQMRLEEMKKELAKRVATINTASGSSDASERDHFMSH